MRQTLLSISPLLIGITLLLLGNGVLGTLLALNLSIGGAASWVVGLVGTAYFSGFILGSFYGRRLITGVGHIRAFAALASSFSAATLAHPFLVDPAAWAGLRFVEGFCLAGLFMCTESWLNERATNAVRGTIFSLYHIVVYLALGLGQFLLNISSPEGFTLFVFASILVSMAVVPVAITRVDAPALPKPVHFGFRQLYGISPLGVFGCFASGLLLGAFWALGPHFAQQIGLDVGGTSQFMGITIIGGLILQWPIGHVSDRFDRRTVLVWLCIAISLASAAMVAATGGPLVVLLILAAIFGGVAFTLYPLSAAHANDYIDPGLLVAASGGLLMAYAVGAAMGPLAAALLMNYFGPGGLFGFAGAVALLTALFTLVRMRMRDAAADPTPFQTVPRTTAVASELDPRAEPNEPSFEFPDDRDGGGVPGP